MKNLLFGILVLGSISAFASSPNGTEECVELEEISGKVCAIVSQIDNNMIGMRMITFTNKWQDNTYVLNRRHGKKLLCEKFFPYSKPVSSKSERRSSGTDLKDGGRRLVQKAAGRGEPGFPFNYSVLTELVCSPDF